MTPAQDTRRFIGFAAGGRKTLAASVLVMALGAPMAASAATQVELQSQVISLFTQIFELQKQVIAALESRDSDLESQLSRTQGQLASVQTDVLDCVSPMSPTTTVPSPGGVTTHACAVINPPPCSTSPTAIRDSYNCVIGYSCTSNANATPIAGQATVQPGASCTFNGTKYASGSTISCTVDPTIGYCPLGLYFSAWTCSNGRWVKSR